MRIAVGSDHAGYDLKARLAKHLAGEGHEVVDLGTNSPDVSVDYPEFGQAVGEAVAGGRVDLGLCVCGTGIGISIAANKVHGVRAALVHDVTTAGLAREHNDANVICFGGRTTGTLVATGALDTFLGTAYAGGRHQRRIDEISAYEAGTAGPTAAPLAQPLGRTRAQGPTNRARPAQPPGQSGSPVQPGQPAAS
jgi:ribose 5-phosphate isomerase B